MKSRLTIAPDFKPVPRGRIMPGWGLAGLLAIAGLLSGCMVVHHSTVATKSMFDSITGQPDPAAQTNTTALLQAGLMREADQFVAGVAEASDDLRQRIGTTDARNQMLQWKLNEARVAYANATDESPLLGSVGMVVLATLSRMVAEDYWVGEMYGEAARPLLQTHCQLETNAWILVHGAISPEQEKELRKLLRECREKYPHMRYVSAVRLPELVAKLGKTPPVDEHQKANSLFSLLYLNPLAGLDPTTQAIQQTRLLAQRMMYYAQRASMLLGWQVELTTYQLASQPESRQVLTNLNEVSQSSTVLAKTAAELPSVINDQREAAINQVFAGIASERTNILNTLNAQEAQLRELLPQVQSTLTAGGTMSANLNDAIKSLTTFVQYVSPSDTNTVPKPVDTNSPPFNILDYGKAAGQIADSAKVINTLLTTVNQSVPQLTLASQQAAADAKGVVNYAFRLALVLIVVLGIVVVIVVRFCRRSGSLM